MDTDKKIEIDFPLEEIGKAADIFIEAMGRDRVFLFDGEMGAGKTTFISEVCRRLGVTDDCGSPTFSIVNEYIDGKGESIFHFDLYRIESPHEITDMGAQDYFESGSLCLVEWPDRLGSLTPDDARVVKLTINDDQTRKLTM